ncbi:hypothetical protein DPMN_091261 [Dreissena polymorpha]|uniref:Uncharacterized protein n=1 Tax=Dreissena polymorpha TaxID=45954 RepID=A0A9D4QZT7_DREPO|nr:hypothetical protein DPMN_091261 [Dreissena polymorpha]
MHRLSTYTVLSIVIWISQISIPATAQPDVQTSLNPDPMRQFVPTIFRGEPVADETPNTPMESSDAFNFRDSFLVSRLQNGDTGAFRQLNELRQSVDTPITLMRNIFRLFREPPNIRDRNGFTGMMHNIAVARGLLPNSHAFTSPRFTNRVDVQDLITNPRNTTRELNNIEGTTTTSSSVDQQRIFPFVSQIQDRFNFQRQVQSPFNFLRVQNDARQTTVNEQRVQFQASNENRFTTFQELGTPMQANDLNRITPSNQQGNPSPENSNTGFTAFNEQGIQFPPNSGNRSRITQFQENNLNQITTFNEQGNQHPLHIGDRFTEQGAQLPVPFNSGNSVISLNEQGNQPSRNIANRLTMINEQEPRFSLNTGDHLITEQRILTSIANTSPVSTVEQDSQSPLNNENRFADSIDQDNRVATSIENPLGNLLRQRIRIPVVSEIPLATLSSQGLQMPDTNGLGLTGFDNQDIRSVFNSVNGSTTPPEQGNQRPDAIGNRFQTLLGQGIRFTSNNGNREITSVDQAINNIDLTIHRDADLGSQLVDVNNMVASNGPETNLETIESNILTPIGEPIIVERARAFKINENTSGRSPDVEKESTMIETQLKKPMDELLQDFYDMFPNGTKELDFTLNTDVAIPSFSVIGFTETFPKAENGSSEFSNIESNMGIDFRLGVIIDIPKGINVSTISSVVANQMNDTLHLDMFADNGNRSNHADKLILQEVGEVHLQTNKVTHQYVGDLNMSFPRVMLQRLGEETADERRHYLVEFQPDPENTGPRTLPLQRLRTTDLVPGEKLTVHGSGEVRLVTREKVIIEHIGYVRFQHVLDSNRTASSNQEEVNVPMLRVEPLDTQTVVVNQPENMSDIVHNNNVTSSSARLKILKFNAGGMDVLNSWS